MWMNVRQRRNIAEQKEMKILIERKEEENCIGRERERGKVT